MSQDEFEKQIEEWKRHNEFMDMLTALTNAVIDVKNMLEKRFDPRDPTEW